mgnify:CR=1 FL=1
MKFIVSCMPFKNINNDLLNKIAINYLEAKKIKNISDLINFLESRTDIHIYFNKKDIKNAFITILLILLSSVVILNMLDKNKLLYLSYIIWISFATYLNYLSLNKIKLCNNL